MGDLNNRRYKADDVVSGIIEKMTADTDANYHAVYLYGTSEKTADILDRIEKQLRSADPHRRIIRTSPDAFLQELLQALCDGCRFEWNRATSDCDCLMIDQIERFIGREASQEQLYLILDRMLETHKYVVAAGTQAPVHQSGMSDRIRSQLEGMLVIPV